MVTPHEKSRQTNSSLPLPTGAVPLEPARTAPDNDREPEPEHCPLCHTPARYVVLNPHRLLDVILVLCDDVHQMHDHVHQIKALVEKAVLP